MLELLKANKLRSTHALIAALLLSAAGTAYGQTQTYNGTAQNDSFPGSKTGEANYNGGAGYDTIDYEGVVSDYGFKPQTNGRLRVYKDDGGYDLLDNMEGAWFIDQAKFYEFGDILALSGSNTNVTVYEGTEATDAYFGYLSGEYDVFARGGYDTVDYEGNSTDYEFSVRTDGTVIVTKPNGETDELTSVDGAWFIAEERFYEFDELYDAQPTIAAQLTHFGEPITLVGANVAWSDDGNDWYGKDIGDANPDGTPRTNITAWEAYFDAIEDAGGNSARVWLHTYADQTPNIDFYGSQPGFVSGLSRELTDAQVVGQMEDILDAAWERGVVVTFSLFSFDMLCDTPLAPKKAVLETQTASYLDNALEPMVVGLKDHPGLFAWEVFNEAEGMTTDYIFCSGASESVSYDTIRLFINRVATRIHALDKNVKVTSSSHTELYDEFSNASILSTPGSDPSGTVDFYSLHWYDTGWTDDPFSKSADSYNADKPVTIGEYALDDYQFPAANQTDTLVTILDNGYAGAWPWSLSTLLTRDGDFSDISAAIDAASAYSPQIDKTAIEACIQNKPTSCYRQ